ncbi:MAG: alpha/beta hydrolase, partial [Spirochaetota bacterium]
VVLIMGLSFQMTYWPESLIQLFLDNGYPVLIFDNRDIGLSTKIPQEAKNNLVWDFLLYKMGLQVSAPYSLFDMAKDVTGILSHFQIPQAHFVGMSMGGMISQILAAQNSDLVKTLTLLATSDNSSSAHPPQLEMIWRLLGSGIQGNDLESAKKRRLLLYKTIKSTKYATMSDAEVLQRFVESYKRNYSPAGILRQLYAILSSPNLQTLHNKISCPTTIIHGDIDPLIHKSSAYRMHKNIPHSKLHVISGYAHDLPQGLMPTIFDYFLQQEN